MKKLILAVLLAPGIAFGGPLIALSAGDSIIVAETAASEASRALGLMGRDHLDRNHGMLFVFGRPGRYRMWMKNTLLPLSVAFMDERGTILNIEDMAPLTLDLHASKGDAAYALEMEQGWFRAHHVRPGERLEGLPPLTPQP